MEECIYFSYKYLVYGLWARELRINYTASPWRRKWQPTPQLQYSCLENPLDRGAWQATVHGVARVGHDLATKARGGLWPFHLIILSFSIEDLHLII